MQGMNNIKYADVQQAKAVYNYKNTKERLYKTNTAIWFNIICIFHTVPRLAVGLILLCSE
jgi:hypothetical protein